MAWGSNEFGQLGDGTTEDRLTPVAVTGLSGVGAIAGGSVHSLALRTDGTVLTWGRNDGGQLGDGTTENRLTPVPVAMDAPASAIACGNLHSLALVNGAVVTWGHNFKGQLGDGTTDNRALPKAVLVSQAPAEVLRATAVAGGAAHSLALREGEVLAWGENHHGQLGDGSTEDRLTPVSVIRSVEAIACGDDHSVAVVGGGVLTWGSNANRELGDGTRTDRHEPRGVEDRPGVRLSEVRAVAAGGSFATLALIASEPVYADRPDGPALQAVSVAGPGVHGLSSTGAGMIGEAISGSGMIGRCKSGTGARGEGLIGVAGVATGASAIGVVADGRGATALDVRGKARFSRSGVATIPANSNAAVVPVAGLSSDSLVLATLQSFEGDVHVACAFVAPVADSPVINILLNRQTSQAVTVAWFVIN